MFKIGDIVKVKYSFLEEPKDVLGYIYDEYDFGDGRGVSIITKNGIDLGGFSSDEQEEFLEFVGHSDYRYEFKNVIKLDLDFERLIKPVFGRW